MTPPRDDDPLPEQEPVPPWVSKRIESLEQAVMITALFLLVVAISWGVLSRYVVPHPTPWIEEVTQISFAWLIFVGAAEVHRRRMHIGVDMITIYMPPRAQRILGVISEMLVSMFCVYAAYLGLEQTIISHTSHTSMLRLPLSVAYTGLTLGLALMAFRSLQNLYRDLRALRVV